MHAPVEVRTDKGYWKRIIGIAIGCGIFAALAIATAVDNLGREAEHEVAYAMLAIAAFLLAVPCIMLLARRRWVQHLDSEGVVLRNGRRFLWSKFQRVEPRWHSRLRIVNNYNLVFEDGTAGVYHLMAENLGEIRGLMQELEAGTNPFKG